MNAKLIEKEAIDVTKFITADVNNVEDLNQKLVAAQRLGNEFKAKATIVFNTTEGAKKVNTTVWAVTEKYIQLKNNVHIPIKSLIDINF